MPDALAFGVTAKIIQSFVPQTLADSIWNAIIDSISNAAGGIISDEVSKKIDLLRSDRRLRQKIEHALQQAVETWAHEYEDRGFVVAVQNTPSSATSFQFSRPFLLPPLRRFEMNPANHLKSFFRMWSAGPMPGMR